MAKQYMIGASVKQHQYDAIRAYAIANGHSVSYLVAELIEQSGIVAWHESGGVGRINKFATATKIGPEAIIEYSKQLKRLAAHRNKSVGEVVDWIIAREPTLRIKNSR